MNGPHTIAAGAHVFVDYLMMNFEPPGQWGHIDLDLGGNGIYDATYFGPLTSVLNQIDIAPGLFVDSTWDLNTPGTYLLHALAYGPGSSSRTIRFRALSCCRNQGRRCCPWCWDLLFTELAAAVDSAN